LPTAAHLRFGNFEELPLSINFSGEFITPCKPDKVYELLSDPNKFAPLLPDFQSMTVQDATHFTLRLSVGLGHMRGMAEVKMELTAVAPHTRVRYKGQGLAMGSQLDFSFGFDLAPLQESSRVSWQSGVDVSGGLVAMAGGMLEPLARANSQKLMDGLQKALACLELQAPAEAAPEPATPQAQPGLPASPSAPLSPDAASPPAATDASSDTAAPSGPN
jgi:carbon monoxide dehydrogenase subunit G